jgi:hypothetical protein
MLFVLASFLFPAARLPHVGIGGMVWQRGGGTLGALDRHTCPKPLSRLRFFVIELTVGIKWFKQVAFVRFGALNLCPRCNLRAAKTHPTCQAMH